jgi:UDP-N-acetylmuramoylalanine--D-glutamate ligase
VKYLVAGVGVAGAASARCLLAAGAEVTVVDQRDSQTMAELAAAGARVELRSSELANPLEGLLDGVTDVVLSPGFAPHHPIATAATGAGLDVYSEPELAWRLRAPGAAPWLAVTGTNGKTTTVTMLASILRAAGLRAEALGNIGVPLVTATTLEADRYDVLAVELSSFQLHWSQRMAPEAGAILNVAEDHFTWHGGFEAYAATKTEVWRGAAGTGTAIGNLDDPWVASAMSRVSGRRIGWTLAVPAPGQLGVVDGTLVDNTRGTNIPLAAVDDIRPVGDHNVSNALAAAALALTNGVGATAIGAGLRDYQPEAHRNQLVTTRDGVRYVDDSKATNPHAALASIRAYPRIVWIAGGQLKGVDVNDLVAEAADRLVAVVLLGVDRAELAAAMARHAPAVPVVDVARTDDGAMREVVRAAASYAKPGDTVLLAPAAASLDMFPSYARRGTAFAEAIEELGA